MANQQTITGMALYRPQATMNRAPYSTCRFATPWMLRSMASPAMAIRIGIAVKAKRCRTLSEMKAMSREKPKAAVHGGMEYSCVVISRR
jgi:hypothetical protein